MYSEQSWILKRAAITPKKTALIDIATSRSWSYKQLADEVKKWAMFLKNCGLQKGDRVAVIAENRIDLFAILFASAIGGYVYVPLNWRLSHTELDYILDDCTPTLLLYEHQFMKLTANKQHMKAYPITTEHLVGHYELPTNNWNSKDPWLIIYTGGTTGKPKGVVLSYNAVNWNAFNTIISWNISSDDCTLNYMPLFHTGGLNALSIPILMAGGTVVIGSKFNPQEAIRALNIYHTTISLFVPTMYQSMIDTEEFKRTTFPTIKVFLSGGAPCPITVHETFLQKGLPFKEGYGLTEAGPNNFVIQPEDAAKKLGSVGKCMQFNEVKIQASNGRECQRDEVGELYIKGKHLFSEYWNNPQETAKTIINGWLRTGDLAKMDQDGDIYIVGRVKEIIISGGENVYPQEVEQCIITHPKVKEVAVIGIADRHWGEIVTAFIVSDDAFNNVKEIQDLCRSHLGSYKIPRYIYFIPELPKTHVGKIDKKKLQTIKM
ncbi:AMP-binding protein [Viridibacillus sp. YIM B01967]|uniref:AMP-binding protein n=1 Tax=Viridibacillus soli TaxID=2798301 RepID=A0ABS1H6J3_9BACL|nr:AMP-binding protein [Viridibacillus soli]MBK3495039.1 AMP-binding protein [Viridibacillus soli]